jgi:hypothetical protein
MTHRPPLLVRAGAVALGVVLLQALLVMWFAWPAERTAPHHLPVVVAGPASAAASVTDQLRTEQPDAFDISTVDDAGAADALLRDRRAYAAFVVGQQGFSLHVASAASPTVAALLGQAAQQMGDGRRVPVVDVVPTPADDPRGAGLAAGFLPLLLTSLGCGLALLFAVRSAGARLLGLLMFGGLAGLVAAAALHGLGVLTGEYLSEAGVIGLIALAISATVTGLGAALGRAGLAVGALLVFFVGNPISGLASAPELLPEPWGVVGHLLPPGAGVSLLRSVAFFDGAATGGPLWTLAGWAAAGLALTAATMRSNRSSSAGDQAAKIVTRSTATLGA